MAYLDPPVGDGWGQPYPKPGNCHRTVLFAHAWTTIRISTVACFNCQMLLREQGLIFLRNQDEYRRVMPTLSGLRRFFEMSTA